MKKHLKQIMCIVSVLTVLMLMSIIASASDINTIRLVEPENGTVEITVDPNDATKAIIKTAPDKGYLAASVTLGLKKLTPTESDANVYTCTIPTKETKLKVQFRRTKLTLSKDELAMNSGETVKISAKLAYIDGNLETRVSVKKNDIIFESSNPDVVSVDQNGKLTAHKMGYSRISATAVAGNEVAGFFYVIVDGDKSEVVGTIQFNAYFEASEFLSRLINTSELSPGHCFLVFSNTSGHDITINTSNMYHCEVPTAAYYEAVNSYSGEGVDPVTYYYATDGAPYTAEDKAARASYAATLTDRYLCGELETYTIKNNDIATFGNTGDGEVSDILAGDIDEIMTRLGKKYDFDNLKTMLQNGEIDVELFFVKVIRLITELGYDFSTDYNPFNGVMREGGVCLNHEIFAQAYYRDYSNSASCKTSITQVQLEAMVDYIQYNNYFTFLERNCTYVASHAWNLVTSSNPKYHYETSAIMAPLFMQNAIKAKAVLLSTDKNIEFTEGLDPIKPMKSACVEGSHALALTGAKITKAGKLTCSDCEYSETGTTLSELNLKIGKLYNENVLGTWRSSNKKVAIVTFTGMIIPLSKGTTEISCRRNGVTYYCTVTVK